MKPRSPAKQASSEATRLLLGIDENGLGPLLGPLVVTAVSARADARGEKLASKKLRGSMAERVGDSKGLVAYGESALGEAWARAIVRLRHADPRSPAELFARLSLDSHEMLTSPCPSAHRDLCFRDDDPFTADEEAVRACTKDITTLASRGLEIAASTTLAICNRRLNEAASRGVSRFTVDLHAMERHVLHARATEDLEVHAVCGKVGGYDFYGPHFGPLAGRLHVVLQEGGGTSAYRFPGLGEIAFVRDADASHLLVGLASLVGKWTRDRLTSSVLGWLRARDASVGDASGYHDPVTKRLVASTRTMREKHAVEDACFLRTVAKKT